MAASQFIFLERNMELDMESFDQAIDYYTGMGKNYQVSQYFIRSVLLLSLLISSYFSSPKERINRRGPHRRARNMRARMD